MVVGEAQILAQLRAAYTKASEHGKVGSVLHELAQQALRVGKRMHCETGIDAAGRSLVSEALAEAATALGGAYAKGATRAVRARLRGRVSAQRPRPPGPGTSRADDRGRRRPACLRDLITSGRAPDPAHSSRVHWPWCGRTAGCSQPAIEAVTAGLFDLDRCRPTPRRSRKEWSRRLGVFLRERAERTGESLVAVDPAP